MRTHPLALAGALLALAAPALRADAITDAARAAQAAGRELKLGDLPHLGQAPGIRGLSLREVQVGAEGRSFTGKARIGESWTRACAFRISDQPDGWALAYAPERFSFGDLSPAVARSPLGGLATAKQVFTLSLGSGSLRAPALPAQARGFFTPVLGEDLPLDLKPGANVHAVLDGPRSELLHAFSQTFGLPPTQAQLVGWLGTRVGEYLVGTQAEDTRAGALGNLLQVELQALLPAPRPAWMPGWFRGEGALFRVEGRLDRLRVELGSQLTLRIQKQDLRFQAVMGEDTKVKVKGKTPPKTTFFVRGDLLDSWRHPLGLRWLDLDAVTLKGSVSSEGSQTFAILARSHLAGREVDVTAGLVFEAEAAEAPLPLFRGRVEYLALRDMVSLVETMAGTAFATAPSARISGLPSIRLEDVEVAVIPPGAKDKQDLETGGEGVRVAGTLAVEGQRWLRVSGDVGPRGVYLKGDARGFQLGPLRFDQGELRLSVPAGLTKMKEPPELVVSGGFSLLGAAQHADVRIGVTGFQLEFDSRVFDLWQSHVALRAAALGGRDLSADVSLENHFWQAVESLGSDHAHAVAQAAAAKLDAATRRVEGALNKVKVHDQQLEAARDAVAAARRKAEADLDAAQRRVDTLGGQYDAAKRRCEKRCDTTVKVPCPSFKHPTKKCKVGKSVPCPDPAACAAMPGIWTAYQTATGVLKATKASADATLRFPSVDADPRVVHLLQAGPALARAVSDARHQAAALQGTLAGALDLAGWIGKQAGKVFVIQEARFHASLAELTRGGEVQVSFRGDFLGRGFSVRVAWDFQDMEASAARLVDALLTHHTHG